MPLWVILTALGGAAYWLFSSKSTSAGTPLPSEAALYSSSSPTIAVASSDSPTAPTPIVVGWNQTQGHQALGSFQWQNMGNSTVPSIGQQVTAQWILVPAYQSSSVPIAAAAGEGGGLPANGIVTAVDSQQNVSFQVDESFPSASVWDPTMPSTFKAGDILVLPLAYVLPVGSAVGPAASGQGSNASTWPFGL